jgi:hypothetical protein
MENETDPSDIGKIGSISADGKLTLNLPDTVQDDKLHDFVERIKGGYLSTTPGLYLFESSDPQNNALSIMYFNKEGSTSIDDQTVTWTKGWNYFKDTSLVTDTSSYKWVINTSGDGGEE